MKAALVLLLCVCCVAVALAANDVPGLREILLQAESDVETVRKSRQNHGGGFGNAIVFSK